MPRKQRNKKNPQKPLIDPAVLFNQKKIKSMEKVLGPMHELVGHAIIPFQVGGPVDMYRFPYAVRGTAFATMELTEPDGSGPLPSKLGTYELVAFTKLKIDDSDRHNEFSEMELHVRSFFTIVARFSYDEILNPFDTCEVPTDDEPTVYLVFDEWKKRGTEFKIGRKKYGLLLCIEVFRSEMEYAMQNGTKELIKLLKAKKYYPYSDLDREPAI